MSIYKLQCSIWSDSVLARDAFVITPHFETTSPLSDPDALCDDLAAGIHSIVGPGGTHQIEVKAYDAQGAVPVFPVGSALINVGAAPASNMPREVALCLSFYSERNQPRRRGRLFIPGPLLGATPAVRPSSAAMDTVMSFGPLFAGLGGPDIDWVVYSRSDDDARPVTNYWCDNEWDTIRSRGLRSTTRVTATTTEA